MSNLKIGDRVKPKIGPLRGVPHKVMHVHPDGHVNISPQVPPRQNPYRLGAIKAKPSDLETLGEEMSDEQMKEREKYVKGMKKNLAGFRKRYGDRAKEVMYATATKMAMKEESEDEQESLDEAGRPSQRHPLEGHPYHKKSEAELRYIIKDAGQAAKAMRGNNPNAENKYMDQVNDASTVLNFRQKHGMPMWYKVKYDHGGQGNTNEETQEISELNKSTLQSYTDKAKKEISDIGKERKLSQLDRLGKRLAGVKTAKVKMDEAIVVYSDVFGQGVVLEENHAEPDTEGNIEWYTVKFDHGDEVMFAEDIESIITEKLDPVGKEDDDVDNDGDSDESDSYLKRRRQKISTVIKGKE